MTRLVISDEDLSTKGLARIVAENQTCTQLVIEADDLHGNDFNELQKLPQLRRLVLHAPFEDLSFLRPLSKRLVGLSLAYVPAEDFSVLSDMKRLKTLTISHTACNLAILAGLPLRELTARKIESVNLQSLPPSAFASLTELNLADSPVNDADLHVIAQFNELQILNLSYTPITDLSPLHSLKKLSELSVNGTHISDEAQIEALTACSSLEKIDVPDGFYFEQAKYKLLTDLSKRRANASVNPTPTVAAIRTIESKTERKAFTSPAPVARETKMPASPTKTRNIAVPSSSTAIIQRFASELKEEKAKLKREQKRSVGVSTKDLQRHNDMVLEYQEEDTALNDINDIRKKIYAKVLPSSSTKPTIEQRQATPTPVLEGKADSKEEKLPTATGSTPKGIESLTLLSPPDLFRFISTEAESGNAGAQFLLGECYRRGGIFVEQDSIEAIRWYQKAADQDHAEAQFYLGIGYNEGKGVKKDPIEAVKWFEKAAKLGNNEAQLYLGLSYLKGRGVTKNLIKAMHWFEEAAKLGNPQAQFNLAVGYREGGEGVEKNPTKAREWLQKAAEAGYPPAQFNLAMDYRENSKETEQNLAREWLQKAAEAGYPSAQFNLAIDYKEGSGGIVKNTTEAVNWYRKAAKQGHVKAKLALAMCYLDGEEGVTDDPAEVMEWLSEAAEQQDAGALLNLAYCYENGTVVAAKDPELAFQLYQKAANLGEEHALTSIGWCYENGQGVEIDLKKAAEYYKQAAAQGDQYAQAVCYAKGYDKKIDLATAIKHYRKAAEAGHQRAQTELGLCYAQGRGVRKNIITAKVWYQKAATGGYLPAKEHLASLKRQATISTPSSLGVNANASFFSATVRSLDDIAQNNVKAKRSARIVAIQANQKP